VVEPPLRRSTIGLRLWSDSSPGDLLRSFRWNPQSWVLGGVQASLCRWIIDTCNRPYDLRYLLAFIPCRAHDNPSVSRNW
jgi:hypothetical protein